MLIPKTMFFAVALLLSLSDAFTSTEPQANLPNGDRLIGSVCPETGVKRYRGIPNAQPPTGNLRFKPPKKIHGSLTQHDGKLDASRAAAPCPQYYSMFIDTDPTPSEDW